MPSRKWWARAELYKFFASKFAEGTTLELNFSDDAAEELFQYESQGKGDLSRGIFGSKTINGYAYGKYWLDWQITAWREGIAAGLLFKFELYQDYNSEWIDRILR